MTTTINKVNDLLEAFPNKSVKHTGRPDYEVLNNIKTALKQNFATVPCTLGGGTHGNLGVILTPAEYAAATPITTPPFVDPPFPGPAAIIPPNSTGPQIAAIERQFNKSIRQWTEYKTIQDGIDDMYLKGITDRNVSLANVTIRNILAILFRNYGNITKYDIEENNKKLKEKWDVNTPIEMLFDQIEDAQRRQANHIPVVNYLPQLTTSFMQQDWFLMTAKHGIASRLTRRRWKTSKQRFNKLNENCETNNALPNKQGSRPMAFGANPSKPMTTLSKKQPKLWPTSPRQPHWIARLYRTSQIPSRNLAIKSRPRIDKSKT